MPPREKIMLEKTRSFFKIIVPYCKWIAIVVIGVLIGNGIFSHSTDFYNSEVTTEEEIVISDEECTVRAIELHGTLLTYVPQHAENDSFFDYDVTSSDKVVGAIKEANEMFDIKAIIIEVDSSGGSGVAGEEIADAIKNSEKPVIAFVRDIGASASYWAISSADKIFASKNSDVGSIGVTSSYLSNVEKNKMEGYTYERLIAGKYKDTGSPDRPLTPEEKVMLQNDLNLAFENFKEAVSRNRMLPMDKVQGFSDGSTVMGERAKSLGMIDEIGGMTEVEKHLENVIGEKPRVCWLQN